jgi:hypothetical protein
MRTSNKFLHIGLVFAGIIGFSILGLNTANTPAIAQGGANMTGMSGMPETHEMQEENMTGMPTYVVRDSVAELLGGRTLPAGGFYHLYDTTPYMIMNGHVAVNVPCEDNSTSSVDVLIGVAPNLTAAELENLPELSTPGEMCLYHVDIPPNATAVITDVAIANPGDSDLEFPDGSTAVVGVNEIMPGAEEGEHGHGGEEEAGAPAE